MIYKLGSLFDGSGGFPLAGSLCGIEPVWASEIEPYPIAVTKERFPNMKHLGDISQINGAEIEPVDIITFGSPCQDLSVAGKRAGLKHEANGDEETTRSGLFMEAVRIIKEMRRATDGKYPRFALWENVPGAFSSNKGEDFRIVLEELVKIVEPSADMPSVPKNGWPYADSYVGDGWSLAYRVFDAQFWGVPQRRRRIHLVVDFRGECGREVLFEREGVRGYFDTGRETWETASSDIQGSAGTADRERRTCSIEFVLDDQGGQQINVRTDGKSPTLRAETHGNLPIVLHPVTYDGRGNGDGKIVNTITGDHENRIKDYTAVVIEERTYDSQTTVYAVDQGGGKSSANISENKSPTLTCTHGGEPVVVYIDTTQADDVVRINDKAEPLQARDYNGGKLVQVQYIVRRLTPTECARLQGFADAWGHISQKDTLTDEEYRFWLDVRNTHAAINGKPVKEYTVKQMLTWYNKLHPDSAEYKMWGNGIALPSALYCMQGIRGALDDADFNSAEEADVTDFTDAPEEIKAEIIKNDELLREHENKKETTEEETMETKTNKEPTTIAENVVGFNAVDQLKSLADERKALADLRPENKRFSDDVRAIEYAVSVLEAVGL